MRNVEFKAELRDPQIARAVARRLNAHRIGTLRQVDTYFRILTGRLKKRETSLDGAPEPVEYIQYDRDDRTRPKISNFQILSEAEFLERFGTLPLPVWLTVTKTRDLYLLDHARIHIDEVEGLGHFIEFEVLVTKDNNLARAHETIDHLRAQFRPVLGEPISGSYSDLLAPPPPHPARPDAR